LAIHALFFYRLLHTRLFASLVYIGLSYVYFAAIDITISSSSNSVFRQVIHAFLWAQPIHEAEEVTRSNLALHALQAKSTASSQNAWEEHLGHKLCLRHRLVSIADAPLTISGGIVNATYHFVECGDPNGEAVVLIPGLGQTSFSFRQVMIELCAPLTSSEFRRSSTDSSSELGPVVRVTADRKILRVISFDREGTGTSPWFSIRNDLVTMSKGRGGRSQIRGSDGKYLDALELTADMQLSALSRLQPSVTSFNLVAADWAGMLAVGLIEAASATVKHGASHIGERDMRENSCTAESVEQRDTICIVDNELDGQHSEEGAVANPLDRPREDSAITRRKPIHLMRLSLLGVPVGCEDPDRMAHTLDSKFALQILPEVVGALADLDARATARALFGKNRHLPWLWALQDSQFCGPHGLSDRVFTESIIVGLPPHVAAMHTLLYWCSIRMGQLLTFLGSLPYLFWQGSDYKHEQKFGDISHTSSALPPFVSPGMPSYAGTDFTSWALVSNTGGLLDPPSALERRWRAFASVKSPVLLMHGLADKTLSAAFFNGSCFSQIEEKGFKGSILDHYRRANKTHSIHIQCSGNDTVLGPTAEEYFPASSWVRRVELEEVGHVPHLESPRNTAVLLAKWLSVPVNINERKKRKP
jgi:pimeloyl-ACP methyl ester carboxylesterase